MPKKPFSVERICRQVCSYSRDAKQKDACNTCRHWSKHSATATHCDTPVNTSQTRQGTRSTDKCLTRIRMGKLEKATDPFMVTNGGVAQSLAFVIRLSTGSRTGQNVQSLSIAGFKRCALLKIETTRRVDVNPSIPNAIPCPQGRAGRGGGQRHCIACIALHCNRRLMRRTMGMKSGITLPGC